MTKSLMLVQITTMRVFSKGIKQIILKQGGSSWSTRNLWSCEFSNKLKVLVEIV